jgi:hypothetical protein
MYQNDYLHSKNYTILSFHSQISSDPVKTVFRDLAFVFPVLSQGIPSSIGFCRCLRHALEFNEDIDDNVDVKEQYAYLIYDLLGCIKMITYIPKTTPFYLFILKFPLYY